MIKKILKPFILLVLGLILFTSLMIGFNRFTRKSDIDNLDLKVELEKLFKEGKTKQAQELLENAAEQGNTEAQHNLAMMLLAQGNIEQSEKIFIKAARKGNVQAQTRLGMLYSFTDKNTEKAKYWYLKAANLDHPQAQFLLGVLLEERENKIDEGACRKMLKSNIIYGIRLMSINLIRNANERSIPDRNGEFRRTSPRE